MTMAALEELTVKRFPASIVRPAIFSEFRRLVTDLITTGIVGEIWTDGSFLTEKAEPEVDDMDLSVRVTVEHFETHPLPVRQRLLYALGGGKRYSPVLDTYITVIFPKGDPRVHGGTDDYWAEKWLMGWDDKLKGFAVILLGETDLGFQLHAR
nr:hypothetical protein [Acidisphaera sp. S103]